MVASRLLTFGELLDGITEHIKAAEATTEIPADAVRAGEIGRLPDWAAPWVAVYVLPIDGTQTASGRVPINKAAVTILICGAGTVSQVEGIKAAVALAERVYKAVSNFPRLSMDRRTLTIERAVSNNAIVSLRGSAPFTLVQED